MKLMNLKIILSIFLIFSLIFLSTASGIIIKKTVNKTNSTNLSYEKLANEEGNKEIKVIRIAQFPKSAGCDTLVEIMFNYGWISNNTTYKFEITELTFDESIGIGNNSLNNENFDILYVGANFDLRTKSGKDAKLQENVKSFIKNGGGFLGSCGGANFVIQGYEDPLVHEKIVNQNVLKIVNVYSNSDWFGEARYLFNWKNDDNPLTMPNKTQGSAPIECKIERNNSNPIFSCYPYETVDLVYGGGPGMYPANINSSLMGEVVPLLIINEELMETKPIYLYRKGILPGYVPVRKVKTDLLGNYGSVATNYGEGKLVIFTGHPEIAPVLDGYVHQHVAKSKPYGFNTEVIRVWNSYVGEKQNMSYNWWIYRRAAAWIAGIPESDFPPYEELTVFIDKPSFRVGPMIYFKDKIIATNSGIWNVDYSSLDPYFSFPILQNSRYGSRIVNHIIQNSIFSKYINTVIIGDITVEIYSENCDYVEFYLDDKLVFTNFSGSFNEMGELSFNYKVDINNFRGIHNLKVIGYNSIGNFAWEESDYVFFNS